MNESNECVLCRMVNDDVSCEKCKKLDRCQQGENITEFEKSHYIQNIKFSIDVIKNHTENIKRLLKSLE